MGHHFQMTCFPFSSILMLKWNKACCHIYLVYSLTLLTIRREGVTLNSLNPALFNSATLYPAILLFIISGLPGQYDCTLVYLASVTYILLFHIQVYYNTFCCRLDLYQLEYSLFTALCVNIASCVLFYSTPYEDSDLSWATVTINWVSCVFICIYKNNDDAAHPVHCCPPPTESLVWVTHSQYDTSSSHVVDVWQDPRVFWLVTGFMFLGSGLIWRRLLSFLGRHLEPTLPPPVVHTHTETHKNRHTHARARKHTQMHTLTYTNAQ